MRVKLPLPRQWPIVADGPAARVAEVLPGVTLTLGELAPLPADLRAWGDQVVLAVVGGGQVRVELVNDTETETGWKVTLFGSDVIDPDGKAVVERRLHALYRFDRFGGVACLAGANLKLFDSVVKEVTAVMLGGGPDWRGGGVLCVSEVWAGLRIEPSAGVTLPDPRPVPPSPPEEFTSDF